MGDPVSELMNYVMVGWMVNEWVSDCVNFEMNYKTIWERIGNGCMYVWTIK